MASMAAVRQKLTDDLRDATDRGQGQVGLFGSRLNRRNGEAKRVSARQQVLFKLAVNSTLERTIFG